MSLNKTLLALAVAVALTACSKPADDAAAPAEVPATEVAPTIEAAPAADTMSPATDALAPIVDGSVNPIIAADAATNENVDTVDEALDEVTDEAAVDVVDPIEPVEEERKEGGQ